MHHVNKTTTTTAILSVSLMIGAAAVLVLSLAENVQAQTTIDEAIELLNTSADVVEDFDPGGADRLRDAAALLGRDLCPQCG
jgi:hypothetical protein